MTAASMRTQRGLLFSACAAFTLSVPAASFAQGAPDDSEAAEQIVVTGSRIRQNPLEVRSPIFEATEADIERSGRTSVADFLQQLPITGSAINANNNASGNLGFPPDGGGIGAGAAQVDLRNLTAKRVLVLVDGKRWISGVSASGVSGAVDLNTIPVNAIQRIEVLQDGASAIYGTDAIAGVVNVITKTDFDGFNASAYLGTYGQGDGDTQEYDLSWGASSERSRVFLDISFARTEAVSAADRDISQFPIAGVNRCLGNCSSGTPQGRFVFTDPNTGTTSSITLNDGVINDGGANIPVFDPLNPGTAGVFHAFHTSDRFNFQPFNFLATPNKRFNVFAKAEHDLTDDITFSVTASYNNRRSANQAAPEPLFIGPDAGNGNLMDTVGIDVTNPFNPFGFSLDAANGFIFAGRRPIEAGPRLFLQNVDTWLVSGTLDGELEFGERTVYWDLNVTWAQNQANQRKFGAFNSLKLKQALGPLSDCVQVDADLDGIDDFSGCTPFNYVGGQGDGSGSITQEMLDFVGFIQKDEAEQQLFDLTFNVTGNLFEMPAGSLGYAIGYEHRNQEGSFTPDAIVTAGNTAGVPSFPTAGEFDVDEFYGEVNIPVIADVPFAEKLELSAAFRISDYDLFGSDTVFKLGGTWRVFDDLTLRGSFTEGFRAPNIGELFNTGSRFDSTISDPCSDMLGLSGGAVASAATQANCIALGVPSNGSYTQFNAQIGVNTGGNQNLVPEEADTWTIGLTYDASWAANVRFLESFTLEFNYYNVDLTGAIEAPDAQLQLNRCVATGIGTSLDCTGINRTPGGVINAFENQLRNIGGIETDGIDWTLGVTLEEFSFGQFRFTWIGAVLIDYTQIVETSGGFVGLSRDGVELGSPERGFPEFKSSFIIDWFKDDLNAAVVVRYISSLDEDCPGGVTALAPGSCSNDAAGKNQIGDAIYTDIQATWRPSFLDQRASFTLGINNLLDEDTPICFSCDLNSFDGTLHPIPGRFFYARVGIQL